MELNSEMSCPKCGQKSFKMAGHLCGLPLYQKVNGNLELLKGYTLTVRPYLCTVCNYVEFQLEND